MHVYQTTHSTAVRYLFTFSTHDSPVAVIKADEGRRVLQPSELTKVTTGEEE